MAEYSEYKENRQIPMKDLIYWVDREFVQWRASELVGRELDEDEIGSVTKSIEWGLSPAALDVVDISIKETIREKTDE